jgi:hypothetical protein
LPTSSYVHRRSLSDRNVQRGTRLEDGALCFKSLLFDIGQLDIRNKRIGFGDQAHVHKILRLREFSFAERTAASDAFSISSASTAPK